MPLIRPDNPRLYLESCLRLANEVLADYGSPAEVAEAADDLNVYPGLGSLGPPESIRVLESRASQTEMGRRAVLEGRVLWEHPAAGEATRLDLGPKFFLKPADLAASFGQSGSWAGLRPVSLGLRHVIQLVLEIQDLARESGLDPAKVMQRQTFLLIASEDGIQRMSSQVARALSSIVPLGNIWFMAQSSFPGLGRAPGGGWSFDPASPRRLHNHGHMAMQKTMDRQIFRLDGGGRPSFMGRADFLSRLSEYWDLASANVEDLDYLSGALDLDGLGLAVRLGRSGYGMMMEISRNCRDRPIKGGMCAHDPSLGRDVVVESFRLRNVLPKDIRFLNKNMNHFLNPAKAMAELADKGLFMPVAVFDRWVYFQPVQGDLNFLVKTAFFTRGRAREINSLKTQADIPAALRAMEAQDARPGFAALASKAIGL
ncbi:MAG: hypothetical protein LBL95_05630 [Deltaproteobacteria bacterium]|jgi:hypothetical protein|nr:hypothetical protein [Deltaproteobacteria bacterium]